MNQISDQQEYQLQIKSTHIFVLSKTKIFITKDSLNLLISAAGSSDYKCRVFSAYVKAIEDKPQVCKTTFRDIFIQYETIQGCPLSIMNIRTPRKYMIGITHFYKIVFEYLMVHSDGALRAEYDYIQQTLPLWDNYVCFKLRQSQRDFVTILQ